MNHLAARGHECHAVFVKHQAPSQIDRVRLAPAGTVKALDAQRYCDWRAVKDFALHLGALRPSAIIAANPYALMYASLARRRAGLRTPLIVTYHSTRLPGLKEELQLLAYRPFFWNADRAVFVCESQKRHAMRRGVFARTNDVIYNGVDIHVYRAPEDPETIAQVRGAQGFARDDFVIGISAWLRPEKNHVQLVEALALLRARGIAAKVMMIGEGETSRAVEGRAQALGVAQHVIITGFRPDVRPLVLACDAMVLCSKAVETFSLAALEAMALARPVVHADLGGAAEMITHGHDGFLFPVGDTAALVDGLVKLCDRRAASEMGLRARATVEARFSEQEMVNRYERMLLELAGADVRSPAAAAHRTKVTR
jgi:glycosyltransferase involved in cell wall biosynthesis